MRDRESTIVGLLVLLMVTVWLGFLLHSSPRFAGSLSGGALGVSGTILMLVPLGAYGVTKRVRTIRRWVTGWMSMRTLLAVHIYTALVGSILVLLHTGHKFDSPLGMALTATVLLVVLSGFVGRYLMSHISQGLREKREMLGGLQLGFQQMREDLARQNVEHAESVSSVSAVVGGIADLEYSIAVHGWVRKWFQKWLRFHRVISGVLCFLLALHVWSGIYYGLRWFQ